MNRDKRAGFNLVELLVTISIVAMISTIVISGQSTYSTNLALTNLADGIGLEISQARSYSTGVRQTSVGSGDFSSSYGLAFNIFGSGSNIAYISFADKDSDHTYDGTWACETSECLSKEDILRGNFIGEICALRGSEGDQCNFGRVDISFVRPSTEAVFAFYINESTIISPTSLQGASIELRSPNGLSRKVIVYITGQISVQ